MIELTKQCEEPTELLECKTYPAIIDLLMNNLKGNEEKGWRYLRGSSRIHCEEGSRIELRNISNLSDLDVNSSVGEGDEKKIRHF